MNHLTTILAQATAGPGFWQVMEHAGLVAAILGAVIMWLTYRRKKETRRIEPDPLRVRKVYPNVREPQCVERMEVVSKGLATLDIYTKSEVGKLHDKIDIVDRRASDNLIGALRSIDDKLGAMPDKIITLLHRTGQLKNHNKGTEV